MHEIREIKLSDVPSWLNGTAQLNHVFAAGEIFNRIYIGDTIQRFGEDEFIAPLSVAPIRLNVDLLKTAYGLTTAEIRTAELVAKGCGLEEVATQLDVSINTVKTQLKHIYDKTGTNNRARLVKLLMTLAS